MAVFRKLSGRAKGRNLPSNLKEICVFDKYWEYLSIIYAFHEKRCSRKLKLKQKSDFIIKQSCI